MHFELLKKISTNGSPSSSLSKNGNVKNGVYHDIIKLKSTNQNILNNKKYHHQQSNYKNLANNLINNNNNKKRICQIKKVISFHIYN